MFCLSLFFSLFVASGSAAIETKLAKLRQRGCCARTWSSVGPEQRWSFGIFLFPSVFPGAPVERRATGNPGGTVVFVSNSAWVALGAKLQPNRGLSLQVGRLGGFCVFL